MYTYMDEFDKYNDIEQYIEDNVDKISVNASKLYDYLEHNKKYIIVKNRLYMNFIINKNNQPDINIIEKDKVLKKLIKNDAADVKNIYELFLKKLTGNKMADTIPEEKPTNKNFDLFIKKYPNLFINKTLKSISDLKLGNYRTQKAIENKIKEFENIVSKIIPHKKSPIFSDVLQLLATAIPLLDHKLQSFKKSKNSPDEIEKWICEIYKHFAIFYDDDDVIINQYDFFSKISNSGKTSYDIYEIYNFRSDARKYIKCIREKLEMQDKCKKILCDLQEIRELCNDVLHVLLLEGRRCYFYGGVYYIAN